jgi:Tol biopolymer transport system component
MDADGSNLRQLTDHEATDFLPTWSPDDETIAFWSKRSGTWGIYFMDGDGKNIRQITDESSWPVAGGFSRVAWSPDGQYIAFVSGRDGNPEIYVMSINGTEDHRLTWDTEEDYDPAWWPMGY